MDTNKMREQFEEWALTEGLTLNTRYGTYFLETTEKAWRSWKASREAVVIDLPACMGESTRGSGFNAALEKCRESINAHGLRTKP